MLQLVASDFASTKHESALVSQFLNVYIVGQSIPSTVTVASVFWKIEGKGSCNWNKSFNCYAAVDCFRFASECFCN